MIDKELLQILACPACKAPVREAAGAEGSATTRPGSEGERIICTSPSCGLRYPVREGIPVMLVEEAEKPGR